jgi:hypothetical protein
VTWQEIKYKDKRTRNVLQCATGSGVIGFLGRMYSITRLKDKSKRDYRKPEYNIFVWALNLDKGYTE